MHHSVCSHVVFFILAPRQRTELTGNQPTGSVLYSRSRCHSSKASGVSTDHAFRVRIDDWPLHKCSREIVASIGNDKPLRGNRDMSFILVPPNQPRVAVDIVEYPEESDAGPFPIPANVPIEGWPKENGSLDPKSLAQAQKRPAKYEEDRHAIVIDPVNAKLYEFFTFGKTDAGWAAGQASIFNLNSNELRPDGWTSADAAGLPIFPAVVRFDELEAGEIQHAMRVTVRRSRRAYVHPATHFASQLDDPDLPRMGERLRLRQDFDVSGFSPAAKTILVGLKRYGMLVADNGLNGQYRLHPIRAYPFCMRNFVECEERILRWLRRLIARVSEYDSSLMQTRGYAKRQAVLRNL